MHMLYTWNLFNFLSKEKATTSYRKRLGKEAPNFNSKKWDKNKVALMSGLCRQKFTNDPKMREMLLMTEDCQLEERNSWNDIFWGCNEKGEGENNLGKLLMNIRHDLATKKEMF